MYILQNIFQGEASAYQPGYFFSRVGSELAFAFGKPSLRSSQAYEKVIPSSRLRNS